MIALAVDLCNSVAVTLFGIALSAAFCNIHWTPKAKKRMLLYTLIGCCLRQHHDQRRGICGNERLPCTGRTVMKF